MRRVLRISVVVVLLLVAAAAPAAAAGHSAHGNSFHAFIDGGYSGFSPGPNEGRCPAGTEWKLSTAGGGKAEGLGAFHYTTEHCSRVVTPTPTGAIGKLAAGILVLTFDTGDKLHIAYKGTWKFEGDLSVGGVAKVHQSWEVIGEASTGKFEGAKGHGHMEGSDEFGHILMELDGGLILAK